MAKDKHKIFEQMMTDMLASERNSADLSDCMAFKQDAMKNISLRNRILALGFVRKMPLSELNEKLQENDCPKLYSRNFWESSLIYAFQNGLSYEEWQSLLSDCEALYAQKASGRYFTEKKITYGELERYVLENSSQEGDVLGTRAVTRELEEGIAHLSDVSSLKDFMKRNILAFSSVREKTRYYFCKYLYYYLNTRIERYLEACRKNRGEEEALSELMALKVVTTLRRKKTLSEEEKRTLIRESAVSSGELFDEFNYFYFDYVSMDWLSVLMEYYGDVSEIPASQKKSLAEILRKQEPAYRSLSDEEVLNRVQEKLEEQEEALQEAYASDSKTKGYGKNRSGEHAVYKYIKGTLDMERTTFICFLLFFCAESDLPAEHALTSERMNEILRQSGFHTLRSDNDFDGFVDEFLNSKEPMDLLMDEVVSYAKLHENSFLYNIYGGSVNYEEDFSKTILGQ